MSLTYCVHFFCVFPLKIKIISELAAAVNTGFVFVRAAPSFIFSVAASHYVERVVLVVDFQRMGMTTSIG